jgi:hypothetical protein
MALPPVDPKKKKATAADQANAIDNTVLGAEQNTSAAKPRTVEDMVKQKEREGAQALLDKDKFQPRSAATVTDTVMSQYQTGLGTTSQVKALEKQGKSVAEIARILGLKPKAK